MQYQDTLLGLIYDTALDRALWPAVLDRLRRMVGCEAGGLLHARMGPVRITSLGTVGIDPAMEARIPEVFADPADNPFLKKFPLLTPGKPISRQQLVGDEEFRRSRIYDRFFKPLGFFHDVTTPMVLAPDEGVGMFLSRPKSAGPTNESDVRALSPWIPHIQRAIRINRRMDDQRAAGAWQTAVLDKLALGALLVDADGRSIAMNEPAEKIIAAADGLELDGRVLVPSARRDRAGLAAAIAAATAGQGGSEVRVRRPSGRRAYSVFVMPLPRAEAVNGAFLRAAAVLIDDPDGDLPLRLRAAARLHGLSPMETKVALEILSGAGRPEVAARLGISPHTVKTHLGRIFDKTGTGSQVELARLLGSAVIPRNVM